MDRELDGVYFRIQRKDKWESVCFSDLSEEQMNHVLMNRSRQWLIKLCILLGKTIRQIGDEFDIYAGPLPDNQNNDITQNNETGDNYK